MTIRRILVFAMGWIAMGPVVEAQTSPPTRPGVEPASLAARYVDPASGVALDRAVAQALEQEPGLRASRSEVDVARGMRMQAGLHPNPTISFSQQEEPAGRDNQTHLEVVWPLDLFRKTGRVGVADREIEANRHVVADRERVLAAEVRSKYGDVAVAIRELAVLDDLFNAASTQQTLVAARVDEGGAPPLERDMLKVEVHRLESERLLQSGAVERAMIELKRLLGIAPDAQLTIRHDLEQLVRSETAVALSTGSAATVETRPDIEVAQSRVQVADARIERARRDGRFDVSLFGGYTRMDAGFSQRAFGAAGVLEPIRSLFHYVAAGAMVTVPLRNRNQGEVAAARGQRAGASAQLEAARLSAQAEYAAARARDERARQAVAIYTSDATRLAKQNLTVLRQAYELGRATVFDVLAEQRRYLEVERGFTNALREAYEARQSLRRALGEAR
jgi:outer membrane protein, heavy metal efflux system